MPLHEGEWWHGTTTPVDGLRPFLHVGTRDQAEMRGGRGCMLLRLSVSPRRVLRRRDTGSWRDRDLRQALSRGYDAIVYLNRYEGIPLEEFEAARIRCDIDALPDARLRKALPSAADSLIVLDPAIVKVLDV